MSMHESVNVESVNIWSVKIIRSVNISKRQHLERK